VKHETQDSFIQITFYNLDKYTLTGKVAKKVAKKLHLNLISGKETKINGLSAFVGDYKGKHFALEKIRVKAAFIAMEDKIYYILCFSKEMEFSFVKDYFEQVIKSFRRLSFHEIKKANPYKLKLYQVKKGDTWKCISHKFLKGKINYKTLALLNGNSPEEGPYKDKIIKIVTY
jgi:predicted Zn-dependent protease